MAHRRKVFRFLRYSREVRRQLEGSEGLVGFSMRAKLLSGRFWTLAAWTDVPALMAFVRRAPHSRIIASLQPHMGATKFVQWRVEGSADPPTWDEGLRRIADDTNRK